MANGIIIIDKPAGWTSMDVCAKLRGILKAKSESATPARWIPWPPACCRCSWGRPPGPWSFAESGEKEYVAGLRLGLVTNTQDTTGERCCRPVRSP